MDISKEAVEAMADAADCDLCCVGTAETLRAQATRIAELEAALIETRAIVCEGAVEGFNHAVGDWAERLYANNGNISRALLAKDGV